MLHFPVFDILWTFSECSVTVVPGLYSENVGLPSVQLGSALGLHSAVILAVKVGRPDDEYTGTLNK